MDQTGDIESLVDEALDRAESVWGGVKALLEKSAATRQDALVPARIPGYPLLDPKLPAVDNFVAMMVDMRGATKHLLQAYGSARVSQLERLFMETSALFCVVEHFVHKHGGSTVEYLGDGTLSLFRYTNGLSSKSFDYSFYYAARDALDAMLTVVNPKLDERYDLPPIAIGIGLGYSKAVVTTVGHEDPHPKIVGECVYRASRLCKEKNEIVIDAHVEAAWPRSDGGGVKMQSYSGRDVAGFIVKKSQP